MRTCAWVALALVVLATIASAQVVVPDTIVRFSAVTARISFVTLSSNIPDVVKRFGADAHGLVLEPEQAYEELAPVAPGLAGLEALAGAKANGAEAHAVALDANWLETRREMARAASVYVVQKGVEGKATLSHLSIVELLPASLGAPSMTEVVYVSGFSEYALQEGYILTSSSSKSSNVLGQKKYSMSFTRTPFRSGSTKWQREFATLLLAGTREEEVAGLLSG